MMYDAHVIHLQRSKSRKRNVAKMQNALDMKLCIFHAIDGLKLNPNKYKNYLDELKFDYTMNRPFTRQHIAIWLSHVLLWEHLLTLTSPAKFHLIFEDDVEILPGFRERLDKYISTLDGHIDILHLYVFDFQKSRVTSGVITKTFEGLSGMQCYLIRHSALSRLVKKIKPMTSTVDEQLSRLKVRNYYLDDHFVNHNTVDCKSENKYVYM